MSTFASKLYNYARMKFISWNVNGIRACCDKGFRDIFTQLDADIFCLQETKLQEGQIDLDLPGYEQFWCYAEKKGYSGTAIFAKHSPISVHYGIDVPVLNMLRTGDGNVILVECAFVGFLLVQMIRTRK